MPHLLSSQTHQSDGGISLQGRREARASFLDICPHGGEAQAEVT